MASNPFNDLGQGVNTGNGTMGGPVGDILSYTPLGLAANSFLGGGSGEPPGWIDMGAAPEMPQFQQIYNPQTMSLGTQMQSLLANDPTKFNTNALNQISSNVANPNESSWAQLQSQLANNQTNQAASRAAGQTAGGTAQAEGNLAMSGGLSSGAAERAQTAGQQAGTAAQQNVQQQGAQTQEQIAAADAANKQQQLMALPGMEAQAYSTSLQPIQMQGQAEAQDMAAQMANNQALNQFNMGAYGNQASMYGAGQTANAQTQATENSGGLFGGGGFLGLGGGGSWLCSERGKIKRLTSEEKMLLSELLRYGRKVDRDFTKWYLKNGKTLVCLAKAKDASFCTANVFFIDQILADLKEGHFHEAYLCYKKHVYALNEKYWFPLFERVA